MSIEHLHLSPAVAAHLAPLLEGKTVSVNDDRVWIEQGNLSLELEDIGEGCNGDYDSGNPDDIPLLRFNFWGRSDPQMPWSELSKGSYCTNLDARLPAQGRLWYALRMFDEIVSPLCKQSPSILSEDGMELWDRISTSKVERLSHYDGDEYPQLMALIEQDALEQATPAVGAVRSQPRL